MVLQHRPRPRKSNATSAPRWPRISTRTPATVLTASLISLPTGSARDRDLARGCRALRTAWFDRVSAASILP